ncbi:hypothetical protein [Nocardiopsis chromatogenes]|uniref:hypothetical protein n=1 Tax=Nocardiopsis chromatogenes TaxID=280239 RepID=UPI001EF9FE62|nr:hypothetical protein [Nocardiopsis chromatogenes]
MPTTTATETVQGTGPLGLVRPRPRGASGPARAFGGRQHATSAVVGVPAPRGHRPLGDCQGDAAGAAQALFAALRAAGVGRVFGSVDARVSVVSLPGGITVWVRGGAFCWRGADGAQQMHSWADAAGAARRLVDELAALLQAPAAA